MNAKIKHGCLSILLVMSHFSFACASQQNEYRYVDPMEVAFFDVNVTFNDSIWDFSTLGALKVPRGYELLSSHGDSILTRHWHGEERVIYRKEKGWYLHSQESNGKKLIYEESPLILPFPIESGCEICTYFQGDGTVHWDYNIHEVGRTTVTIGRKGELILPDEQIVEDVVCLHNIKESVILYGAGSDSTTHKLADAEIANILSVSANEVTETYTWIHLPSMQPILTQTKRTLPSQPETYSIRESLYWLPEQYAKEERRSRAKAEAGTVDVFIEKGKRHIQLAVENGLLQINGLGNYHNVDFHIFDTLGREVYHHCVDGTLIDHQLIRNLKPRAYVFVAFSEGTQIDNQKFEIQ